MRATRPALLGGRVLSVARTGLSISTLEGILCRMLHTWTLEMLTTSIRVNLRHDICASYPSQSTARHMRLISESIKNILCTSTLPSRTPATRPPSSRGTHRVRKAPRLNLVTFAPCKFASLTSYPRISRKPLQPNRHITHRPSLLLSPSPFISLIPPPPPAHNRWWLWRHRGCRHDAPCDEPKTRRPRRLSRLHT